ncbi:MAG: S-methyl-5'-thioinosine phosphorylase [Woeseiaceae bacterium]|nr:S-methyl-5'-thioinosine phosphorylase [Woeseiaceae bacterium]
MPETTAIIVGSGCQDLLEADSGRVVDTAYGAPSAPIQRLTLGGASVAAIARHGVEHTIPPHRINYRANVAALASVGINRIIGLNTVGVVTSLREPGQLGIPDQIVDYTWGREHTFFTGDEAGVQHIEFTEPFSAALRRELVAAAASAGVDCHDGGVYAATQGPRLETAAEVDRLERDGADYLGMTGMPEASLARELGLDYACIALVVNKAAGRGDGSIHDDIEAVSLEARRQAFKVLDAFFERRQTDE